MPATRKWWFLPPAVALLLVLGPLSMSPRGGTAAGTAPVMPPATTTPPATATPPTIVADPAPVAGPTTALPRTPDLWQVASTLVGVLLVGGVLVLVLRRWRGTATVTGQGAVTLRQTLRLSPRRALHAVEFDGRLLLLAEGEHGVALVHAGQPPEHAADESAVASRTAATGDDDGAVPKDLVLPRPALPRRTATVAPARRGLGDFRALLAKAGH